MRMLEATKRFLGDQSASAAIEYGLIAAGIAVAIISVLSGTQERLITTFSKVRESLSSP